MKEKPNDVLAIVEVLCTFRALSTINVSVVTEFSWDLFAMGGFRPL
jgi:hypothetical protein